jgi:SAM domain (Sterile alpha motif)
MAQLPGVRWVSTIAEWLASLGLSEYAQRFAENGVDTEVLPELTDQDLEKLGVVLGHRRKMLRAIRELQSITGSATGEPPTSVPVGAQPAPRDTAERRQLTVMVLRPGRLDRALYEARSGGLARGHQYLPSMHH